MTVMIDGHSKDRYSTRKHKLYIGGTPKMITRNKMAVITNHGADRDKVIKKCLDEFDQFSDSHKVVQFQLTEAQVISNTSVGVVQTPQGMMPMPEFEMRIYCLYEDDAPELVGQDEAAN